MSRSSSIEIQELDLAALERLAGLLVSRLPKHVVIGLVGTLGAGKTTLVQAISRAAGIDSANVTSPTFTLLQSHQGEMGLHHLDAYRVADEDEFLELGVEELFDDESFWTLIEWADRVRGVMPRDTLWIEIKISDGVDMRSAQFTTTESSVLTTINQIASEIHA